MTKKSFDDYVKKGKELDVINPNQQQIQNVETAINKINYFEEAKRELGIFSKGKLIKDHSNFLLDKARAEHNQQLELIRHNLIQELVIGKKAIDRRTEYILEQIDKQYLEHIKELKTGNYETRIKLQIKLAQLSQKLFKDIKDSDLADFLKEDLINRVIDERKCLADEIGLIKKDE